MGKNYKLQDVYREMDQYILNEHRSASITHHEARQIAELILEHFLQISRNDVLMNRAVTIREELEEKIWEAAARVVAEEPVQYVLGEAHFYGRNFKVSPAALIPRRETEELVHLVVKENSRQGLKILDIGTGSGCIAITLNKEISMSEVSAWDISPAAIKVAEENARLHQTNIHTAIVDIMDEKAVHEHSAAFDVVVSNPPYVRKSEAKQMENNVLKYEPHLALFVDDAHPLLFYRQIAELCIRKNLLKKGGCLYLEINEDFGRQTAALLEVKGFQQVEIIQDMQKKDRFVKGILPFSGNNQ